jgi:hypothetical protein
MKVLLAIIGLTTSLHSFSQVKIVCEIGNEKVELNVHDYYNEAESFRSLRVREKLTFDMVDVVITVSKAALPGRFNIDLSVEESDTKAYSINRSIALPFNTVLAVFRSDKDNAINGSSSIEVTCR